MFWTCIHQNWSRKWETSTWYYTLHVVCKGLFQNEYPYKSLKIERQWNTFGYYEEEERKWRLRGRKLI